MPESTFRVVYLPTNQCYAIAWGSRDPQDMQLLRTDLEQFDHKLFYPTRAEAQEVLDALEAK